MNMSSHLTNTINQGADSSLCFFHPASWFGRFHLKTLPQRTMLLPKLSANFPRVRAEADLSSKKESGQVCKPDSVRPDGAARGDHSSGSQIASGLKRPTRGLKTGRASPPLLFGLAPRGVCRASGVAARAVGSYPTFSPLPCTARLWKTNRRFCLRLVIEASWLAVADHQPYRRSILCGTVRGRAFASSTPWRYQARCPAVSGLSSTPTIVRSRSSDHPTCPPVSLYAVPSPCSTRK